MPRIRTVKPEFWTDESVVELEYHERLLFIGLWNFCDDQGFIDYKPKQIKMRIFPGDTIDVEEAIAALHRASLVVAFESPDGVVLRIRNWSKHQRVTNPAKPRFSLGDLRECTLGDPTVQSPREESLVLSGERKGKEGKGEEGRGSISSTADAADPTAIATPETFPDFWAAYPRRDARRKAESAYRSALKRASAAQILLGARRYADDPNREDAFTAMATTWLNGDRWEDGPLPDRTAHDRRPTADDRAREHLELAARFRELENEPPADLFPQIGS